MKLVAKLAPPCCEVVRLRCLPEKLRIASTISGIVLRLSCFETMFIFSRDPNQVSLVNPRVDSAAEKVQR